MRDFTLEQLVAVRAMRRPPNSPWSESNPQHLALAADVAGLIGPASSHGWDQWLVYAPDSDKWLLSHTCDTEVVGGFAPDLVKHIVSIRGIHDEVLPAYESEDHDPSPV